MKNNPMHTPGPWTAYPQYGMFAVKDALDRTVVRTPADTDEKYDARTGSPYTKETAAVNVKLIAAAPELLEALKIASERLMRLSHMAVLKERLGFTRKQSAALLEYGIYGDLDKAIAKAEGR